MPRLLDLVGSLWLLVGLIPCFVLFCLFLSHGVTGYDDDSFQRLWHTLMIDCMINLVTLHTTLLMNDIPINVQLCSQVGLYTRQKLVQR